MRKYLLFAIIILTAFSFLGIKGVKAASLSGWAWVDPESTASPPDPPGNLDIGWVSFNSLNFNPNGNTVYEGAAEGAPTGCPSSGTVYPYNVDVDLLNGLFSDYAWSENIGWIQFNPAGPYPAAPNYSACLDLTGAGQACDGIGDNNVGGWARALAYGGGWDGWIKLRGTNYGVSRDTNPNPDELTGFAWGGDDATGEEVVGWISFRGSNYKVYFISTNQPPSAINLSVTNPANYCGFSSPPVTLNWQYSDLDDIPVGTDPQSAYRVQVDDDGDFTAGIIADTCPTGSGCSGGASNSYGTLGLLFNTTYYWRVMVWDSQNVASSWATGPSFATNPRPPATNFAFAPSSPGVDEIVQFTDQTTCYDGDSICNSWSWNFGDGSPPDANQNPTHTYSVAGPYSVTLTATDSNGSCPTTKSLTATVLPKWKEIAPTSFLEKLFATLLKIFFV